MGSAMHSTLICNKSFKYVCFFQRQEIESQPEQILHFLKLMEEVPKERTGYSVRTLSGSVMLELRIYS